MGWLFAVALGLQERSTVAVFRAIVPLALGHLASVAIVVLLAVFAALQFPHLVVHRAAAVVLLLFGAYRLIRVRHPRWVGMRVGFWGLALWGFLMSSAHGAGLMLTPFVIARHGGYLVGSLMIGVHTVGYLLALTLVALVVYARLGVAFLRTAWFNVDALWAAALLATGLIALFT
jgi:hypothetical protein